MSKPYDWSTFVVRINVNAPIAELYNAWTTQAGMEKWFLRLSEYKKADSVLRKENERVASGDTYLWLWHGWSDETAERGNIIEANGKDLFKFSFGRAGNCTVKIFQNEGETIVELRQENVPTDENGKHSWHLGCKTGWTFYFANMKSLYEGGIDLRNKNISLQGVINS